LPVKTSLNWTMPALVNSSVGSLAGTRGLEATSVVAPGFEEVEEGAPDLGRGQVLHDRPKLGGLRAFGKGFGESLQGGGVQPAR
jgi:hypothetical protein